MAEVSDSFQPEVEVSKEDMLRAMRHGMELYWDGSTPTHRLDQRGGRSGFTRYVNARIEGKLGEVAFCEFLEEYYGIEAEADFRIYGDYTVTDDGDVRRMRSVGSEEWHTPERCPEIKKSKRSHSWLAVRESVYDRVDSEVPFVLTQMDLRQDIELDDWDNGDETGVVPADMDRIESYADEYFPLQVKLAGTAYKDEFTDYIEQGEKLPKPQDRSETLPAQMRRNNYGVPVEELDCSRTRWNRVVEEMVAGRDIGTRCL